MFMFKSEACISTVLALAMTVATISYAEDWQRWRGPAGDGISQETGWSPDRLAGGADVVWQIDVGMGHSAVAVGNGRVYTMGARPVPSAGPDVWEDVVFCLDEKTGKQIWSYSYRIEDKRWPGPGSTPLLDRGRLYTLSWQGHVHSFDAEDGAVMWRRNIVEEKLSEIPEWGFSSSPVIEGDLLVLNAGRSGVTLDRRNGKVLWKSEPEAGGLATPVFFDFAGQRQAAILAREELFVVDPATGVIRWSHRWGSYADPVVVGDTVLLASGQIGDRGTRLLKMAANAPEELWYSKRTNTAFQSYVVLDGFAYGLRQNRRVALECIDMKTGDVKWTQEMGEWGSMMAAGDTLIIARGDGTLVMAKATPDAYSEISSARVFSFKDFRSYPENRPNTCWTAPVLANGRIYARSTYGQLACIDVRPKQGV